VKAYERNTNTQSFDRALYKYVFQHLIFTTPKTNMMNSKYNPDELELVSKLTVASLHVWNDSNVEDNLLSARVHIKAPNPSVDQYSSSLATPSHICCVIDCSGSMGLPASSKDENGNAVEDAGLTILDIVKFSTVVIAESLSPQDKLSIVTYSDNAVSVLPPTDMTDEGKASVKAVLATIQPDCRTNLFAGLECGVKQANKVGDGYINSVFILTDGYPNIHPAESYEVSISKVLCENPISGALSTFGFGYNLDSKLLVDIAKIGGGYFSFIADAGMVGTCFINALANSRCVFGVNPVLKISGCDLSKSGIIPKNSFIPSVTSDDFLEARLVDDIIYVKLTPLRYGCDVDVILKPFLFHNRDSVKIELVFDTIGGKRNNLDVILSNSTTADELFHSKRATFVREAIKLSVNTFDEDACNTFVSASEESIESNSNLDALYQDMKGEATEAISSQKNFTTWGKHFLLSLSTAHLHQFCNNFRDPGVQVYGTGILFSSLQDSLDDIFEKIPSAQPSRQTGVTQSVQMSKVYNNRNTTCVDGKTILRVKTQSLHKIITRNDDATSFSTSSFSETRRIPICNIKKGDLVLTADGSYVKVDCLVETVVDDKTSQKPFDLIKIGQLCVTPYHPVKVDQIWQFPIQIAKNKQMAANDNDYITAYSVYNLVLERGERHKAVVMDGVETITLGHGITNNIILQHDYFGTDRVIDDFSTLGGGIGWEGGHIVLREKNIKRNSQSGCISQISEVKSIEKSIVHMVLPCAV